MTWVLYLIIACGALSIAYGVATTRAVLASDPGTPRMIGAHEEREEGHGTPALAEWPEPISEGRIDLGPLIYETLATSLEPYPKREGVSFEWSQEGEASNREPITSPFAALGALKRP